MPATKGSALLLCLGTGAILAQASEQKPQYALLAHPTLEEMQTGLRSWQRKQPERLRVETRGRSPEGRPLFLCRVTDYRAPDEDKECVLISTTHASGELNAVTGCLHLVKWLISDDPLAGEIRRRQVVLVMPCLPPDRYAVPGYGLNRLGGTPASSGRGMA